MNHYLYEDNSQLGLIPTAIILLGVGGLVLTLLTELGKNR